MGAVFNDFLHQTISASTILAGICHVLQKIPQVSQIPEIEKMKRIAIGIGTTATATYVFANSNNRIKKLVLGIRLAAIGSTMRYAYNLMPKVPVKALPTTPPRAPVVKPPISDLGTAIATTAKTVQEASNLVPSNTITAPVLPPAVPIKTQMIGLCTGLAATAKNAYSFLTSKKMQQLAQVAAIAITIHTLYKLVRGSTVTPPPPPPPPPPPVAPVAPPPRITQGTRTGLYTERSTEEIANLALISMLSQNMQTSEDIDRWIQQSAANVAPAPLLGANIVRAPQIATPQIAGTNTFDFTQALDATLAAVRTNGRPQGGLLRINGRYKSIVVSPSINAGHFIYRYFNPLASFHAPNASIIEMGDPQQFTDFLNKQVQPFWATDPPNTVCACIPCTIP